MDILQSSFQSFKAKGKHGHIMKILKIQIVWQYFLVAWLQS